VVLDAKNAKTGLKRRVLVASAAITYMPSLISASFFRDITRSLQQSCNFAQSKAISPREVAR
jgi:hypothetical protein